MNQIWPFYIQRKSAQNGKPIYFIVPHRLWGSSMTRGYQVSKQLAKEGCRSDVIDLSDQFDRAKKVRESIIVFIKAAFQNNTDLMLDMQQKNNTIIWDPMDGLLDLKEEEGVKMFDGVMLSNQCCEDKLKPYFKEGCVCEAIYHHWDPRCKNNTAREYKLVYLGDTTPENIKDEYIRGIRDLTILKSNSASTFKKNNFLKVVRDYNCHFSVRQENTDAFNFKPNVKLSFASANYANIVLSREPANTEVLDQSYPFYTDSNIESVKKTVEYSKEAFGSRIWEKALTMMEEVRQRTSLKRISKDYIQFFGKF